MDEILAAQLADDFCCSPCEAAGRKNIFTVYVPRPGRRKFQQEQECLLKIACAGGKLLVTGREEIVTQCEQRYRHTDAAWFMEMQTLRELDGMLAEYGAQIGSAHPFFIPGHLVQGNLAGYETQWYGETDIEVFRQDNPYPEAYAFCPEAPDVLGISASQDGTILGMAGASRDSERMYQIGIDVSPQARGRGLAAALVAQLARELRHRGILPFYGTSLSHVISQRAAIRAGFEPAWAELYAQKRIKTQ